MRFNQSRRGGGGDVVDPFHSLRSEMDRVIDDFVTLSPFRFAGSGKFTPALEVSETGQEVRVRAELPGLSDKDVELALDRDLLTIKGEKREEKAEEGESRHLVERSYGAFSRTVRLPFAPDEAAVSATFSNGVLTVVLPKPPELAKQPTKIEIKVA